MEPLTMDTMNMNIDTLLEAAIFLEKRTSPPSSASAKARAKAVSFHPYAKVPSLPSAEERDGAEGELGEFRPADIEMSPTDEGKERRRAGGAGTREVHNKLEKNRRAHLKECFEQLKRQIPSLDDKRTSNLSILRCSLRYIQMLKRKEKEFEQEMQQLAKEKIRAQERIATLKRELAAMNIDVDIPSILSAAAQGHDDEDTASDSTATADNESPIVSDVECDDEEEEKYKAVNMNTTSTVVTCLTPSGGQPSSTQTTAPVVVSSVTTPSLTTAKGEDFTSYKSHVASTTNMPAPQPLTPAQSSLAPPKHLASALRASTPIVLAPINQSHAVLAMPSARALASVSKVMPAGNQQIVSLTPGMMAGTVLSTVPPPASAPSPATVINTTSVPATTQPSTTTSSTVSAATTLKTPVAQILQQTLAQRALAHHLQQQQQARLQQQQQNQSTVPQAPKVITVQGPIRHNFKPLTQLRQAVTVNHLVPSILTPGASILATPAALTSTQLGTLTPVGKAPTVTATVPEVPVSTATMAATLTTGSSTSSSPALSPAVTFTTMKQFLTPQQLPTHVMSLSGTHMSALSQLMVQGQQAQRGTTAVQQSHMPASASTPQGAVVAATTSVSISAMAQGATVPSVASYAQHVTPGTSLVAPLSVVSPATVQVTPGSGLSNQQQAQLSLVNSPILRSLSQIPIQLQQPFNLSQLMKPVVMVTVPSVVTTSSSTPASSVQLQLPVTHAS